MARIRVVADRNPVREVLEFEPLRAMAQTRDGQWHVDGAMVQATGGGLDLSELLRQPVLGRLTAWVAQPAELYRSLAQWHPRYGYEQWALRARP